MSEPEPIDTRRPEKVIELQQDHRTITLRGVRPTILSPVLVTLKIGKRTTLYLTGRDAAELMMACNDVCNGSYAAKWERERIGDDA